MKKIRIWVYGNPLTGKSYFANTFPNPYTINTDGNARHYDTDYEIVTDYLGFSTAIRKFDDKKYDTLIIDLADNIYDFTRTYFLKKHKIEHESELGYGKGWDVVEKGFMEVMRQIVTLDCNIVLVSHERTVTEKDKFGRETTRYSPNIREKVADKIVGLMDFVGRVYKDEVIKGDKVTTDYYLSIGSTGDELGGVRLPMGKALNKRVILNNYDALGENIIEKTKGE